VHGLGGRSFQESFLPPLILQLHGQCLNGRDLPTAKALECILHSSLPPGSVCRDKFIVEMGIQTCYRLCHSHDWSNARELALELLQLPFVKTVHRPKLLILLAGMELESTANRFASALPHLMEAITICEESSMHDLHAVALVVLARVFLRTRNPKRALSVLKSAIPALLPRVQSSHQAGAYLTQAKCYIQLAEAAVGGHTAAALKKKRYQEAFQGLKTSECLFRQCQNDFGLMEVYYLQARLLFLLERTQECETASKEYLRLQQTKTVQPCRLESLCSMVGASA
jgi:hypothetical protein